MKPAHVQRMRTGSATKGARDYHWAMIEVTRDDTPERARRRAQLPAAPAAPLHRHRQLLPVLDPGPVPLAKLIAVAVARWRIEEDHQLTKQVTGLDSRTGHHLDLLAPLDRDQPARLRLPRRRRRLAARPRRQHRPTRADPRHRPELLRQLRDTVIPAPRRDQATATHWSLWRRRHQYRARQAHQRWHAYADDSTAISRVGCTARSRID